MLRGTGRDHGFAGVRRAPEHFTFTFTFTLLLHVLSQPPTPGITAKPCFQPLLGVIVRPASHTPNHPTRPWMLTRVSRVAQAADSPWPSGTSPLPPYGSWYGLTVKLETSPTLNHQSSTALFNLPNLKRRLLPLCARPSFRPTLRRKTENRAERQRLEYSSVPCMSAVTLAL